MVEGLANVKSLKRARLQGCQPIRYDYRQISPPDDESEGPGIGYFFAFALIGGLSGYGAATLGGQTYFWAAMLSIFGGEALAVTAAIFIALRR